MADQRYTDEELIEALERNQGNKAATARDLHYDERALRRRLKRLALKGYSPDHDMTHAVPDGFKVKGVSTYYNKDGQPTGQWVKSTADSERQYQLMVEACNAMTADLPKFPPVALKHQTNSNLMAVYPIGDAHIGMRAWGDETQGQNWDMQIAEQVQCGAMAALVEAAPAADKAVIINLGDWFHADNMEGMTSRSGHVMDLDGRYAKMIHVGMKVMRQCIKSALDKHGHVEVINVVGNHDDTGALWMSVALSHAYENEPRVTINDTPSAFHYVEFGKTLIGAHHGHTCKGERLPGVMAADQAKAWGRTEHRYWYLGHVHHQSVKEYAGVTVESFNTLTAKDAYAAFGGYRARQNMKCIIIHKEYGEVSRHTVHPDMLRL